MKLDTHQHFWHYTQTEFPWISEAMPALRKDCMPNDVAGTLQAQGVDGVVAVQARCMPQETDFLLALAARHPQVLGVVGWVDLGAADVQQQLERWTTQPALRGFRHIVQDEPDVARWVLDERHALGMRAIQRAQLVYDVLVFDHQLSSVTSFCGQHDQHWLVLDHMGKPAIRDWGASTHASRGWAASLRELASMPHVMCKLSGAVTETAWSAHSTLQPHEVRRIHACFDQALELFGPQRVMFGSDWPVCQLAAPYESVFGLAQTWAKTRLTQQEQSAFWSGNAIRCYGLNVSSVS